MIYYRTVNQDALEIVFSVFRQRGGSDRNPTVRTHLGIIELPETINYNSDDDILLLEFGRRTPQVLETGEGKIVMEKDASSSSSLDEMNGEIIKCTGWTKLDVYNG